MKILAAVILFFVPALSLASLPVLSYREIECQFYEGENLVRELTGKMITLVIDDTVGRFGQIQFGDGIQTIQYQILIENDPQSKDGVLVLQNLLVDELESSAEFVAKDVSWVRIAQGEYSVTCRLVP